MAGRYDFTIKQGSTFGMVVKWIEGKLPTNLEGYSARMQIRYNNHFGSIASDLTVDNGGIEVDLFNQHIKIYISAEDTAKIKPIPCVYDLEVVKGDWVERILEGKISISPEVTR